MDIITLFAQQYASTVRCTSFSVGLRSSPQILRVPAIQTYENFTLIFVYIADEAKRFSSIVQTSRILVALVVGISLPRMPDFGQEDVVADIVLTRLELPLASSILPRPQYVSLQTPLTHESLTPSLSFPTNRDHGVTVRPILALRITCPRANSHFLAPSFADLSVSILGERSIYVLGSIVQGLCALCDIVITAGLIYYLSGYRHNGLRSCVSFYVLSL